MEIKLHSENIKQCNPHIFGDWITNNHLEIKTHPYSHIVIDNFLKKEEYQKILNEFPKKPDQNWWQYNNPLEVKFAHDKINDYPSSIYNLFHAYCHDSIITKLRTLFNIPDLDYDPYCHGGGMHAHPRYGRLNMHLDYEIHPALNKKRRLNIIFYVNPEWKKEWHGETQLWNQDMSKCSAKSYPKGNRALIFVTNDISWHGIPEKILCPENTYRKSIAFYYLSDLKENENKDTMRTKANYTHRPNDKVNDALKKLYKIRPQRRIEQTDIETLWPNWNPIEY